MSRVRSGQMIWREKWICRLKLQKRTERKRARGKTHQWEKTPGNPRAVSPQNQNILFFLLWMTCHARAPVMAKAGWQRATRIYPPRKKEAKFRYLLHPQSLIYSFWCFHNYDTNTASIVYLPTALLHRTYEQIPAEIFNIDSNQPLQLQQRHYPLLPPSISTADSDFIPVRINRNAFRCITIKQITIIENQTLDWLVLERQSLNRSEYGNSTRKQKKERYNNPIIVVRR